MGVRSASGNLYSQLSAINKEKDLEVTVDCFLKTLAKCAVSDKLIIDMVRSRIEKIKDGLFLHSLTLLPIPSSWFALTRDIVCRFGYNISGTIVKA